MSDLLTWLKQAPRPQAVEWELEKNAAIRKWCLRDVKFKEGDRVKIVREQSTKGGWAGYEDVLAVGATGIVREIDFNPFSCGGSGAWHAEIVLDHEWYQNGNGEKIEVEMKHTFSIVVGDLATI